ncbi:hypothetical protein L1887_36041 [Cichorium endivia]|nr:hypothetical protein L1887_36041 [Cichorium endivia]
MIGGWRSQSMKVFSNKQKFNDVGFKALPHIFLSRHHQYSSFKSNPFLNPRTLLFYDSFLLKIIKDSKGFLPKLEVINHIFLFLFWLDRKDSEGFLIGKQFVGILRDENGSKGEKLVSEL